MAAASADSREPRARHAARASVLGASATAAACACLAGGGAALLAQAGLGRQAHALWMSALALAAMMSVPLLMSRVAGRYTTLASAATLIVTMSAMSSAPVYLNGAAHGSALAGSSIALGAALWCYRRRWISLSAQPLHDVPCSTRGSAGATDPSGATALLALLAGLSSGTLARFQLFAMCGVGGAQPLWHIALSLTAVCALACIADRSRGNRMLAALYMARAALTGTLAAVDNPALAPLAATLFLVLDCLTIPALVNRHGHSDGLLRASCPGVAHHAGMLLGAALSTTPYFFGDGFVLLYASGAAANLICAASLASPWRFRPHFRRHFRPPQHPYRRQANLSG